jgi:V-type H+-transporting ATPase subunit H
MPLLQLVGTSGSGARILTLEANPYIFEYAAVCAANMIAADPSDETVTSGLFSWVLTHIKLFGSLSEKQVRVTEVACEVLMILLRNESLRTLFLEDNGVQRLMPLLSAKNTQILYDAVHCLWLISLHRPAAGTSGVNEIEKNGDLKAVMHVCRLSMPIKVQRLSLAVLANLVRYRSKSSNSGVDFVHDLVESHISDVVSQLLGAEPKVSDPELLDDLSLLSDALANATKEASNGARSSTAVQRLEQEVATGRLSWSSLHSSDFWKDNATLVESNGSFSVVKALADLLQNENSDDITLAVALFDLGEFAAVHPQGKAVLNKMGVKALVIGFLKRAEDDVKHQALLALSKLMITRWQFVSGGAPVTA